MTLADAIRKGAAQHPQCVGSFFRRHPLEGIIATCVLGATMVGLFGAAAAPDDLDALFEAYPELLVTQPLLACPVDPTCPRFRNGPYATGIQPLFAALAHLNDFHRWTREQCADWVEARG